MSNRAHHGFFITFEGPDGSGKTTQLRLLQDWLLANGVEPVMSRQPGGTPLGERLRAMLLDSRSDTALGQIAPLTELALMFADRAQLLAEIILPALEAGRIVLCDRYTDSSEAYQGRGRALGTERVHKLHGAFCDDLQPDLTILLLPDIDAALARARARNDGYKRQHGGIDENRFEAEGEAFYRRVYSGYEAIAAREQTRVVCIAGDDDIEAVAQRIRTVVADRLPLLLQK